MATAVPQKGASGRFVTDTILEFLKENGDGENSILVKTDQEASIRLLIKDLVDARGEGKTLIEEAPQGTGYQFESHGSNGAVERVVFGNGR